MCIIMVFIADMWSATRNIMIMDVLTHACDPRCEQFCGSTTAHSDQSYIDYQLVLFSSWQYKLAACLLRSSGGWFVFVVCFWGAVWLAADGYIDKVPKNYDTFQENSLMTLIDAMKSCAGIAQWISGVEWPEEHAPLCEYVKNRGM